MLFYIGMLATSLSIDAFGVGIVYGIRKVKMPLGSKLIICFFSMLYAGTALIIGKSLYKVLPPGISNMIGVVILILMGVWIIVQSLLKKGSSNKNIEVRETGSKTVFELVIKSLGITVQVIKNPSKGDIDMSGTIDLRESVLLGLALSIDAIGVGIASALAGFQSPLLPLIVGLFQLLFLYIGTYLGQKFCSINKSNQKILSLAPGFLLILLAILRLL